MRKGFGLITAIVFMVIIAILGTYAMLAITKGVQESNDTYLKTQADILNKNALEHAIFKVRNSATCLDKEYIYFTKDENAKLKFQPTQSSDECLFETKIGYTYYNSNICGKNTTGNYMPNHKMIVKAEAVTTTCKFLDGSGGNVPRTNKISTYDYVIIGK